MKFLLVFLVVMLVAWRWRSDRSDAQLEARRKQSAAHNTPQAMVRCELCGVHLPQNDAVTGQRGSYCCTAHRQKAEP